MKMKSNHTKSTLVGISYHTPHTMHLQTLNEKHTQPSDLKSVLCGREWRLKLTELMTGKKLYLRIHHNNETTT